MTMVFTNEHDQRFQFFAFYLTPRRGPLSREPMGRRLRSPDRLFDQ
jgi:hypothetical protein